MIKVWEVETPKPKPKKQPQQPRKQKTQKTQDVKLKGTPRDDEYLVFKLIREGWFKTTDSNEAIRVTGVESFGDNKITFFVHSPSVFVGKFDATTWILNPMRGTWHSRYEIIDIRDPESDFYKYFLEFKEPVVGREGIY